MLVSSEFRVQEKLPVSLHSQDRRFYDVNVAPTQSADRGRDFLHRILLCLLVAYDSSLAHQLPADLKLRLYQHHQLPRCWNRLFESGFDHRREDECNRDERDVDCDESKVRSRGWQLLGSEIARVGFLQQLYS